MSTYPVLHLDWINKIRGNRSDKWIEDDKEQIFEGNLLEDDSEKVDTLEKVISGKTYEPNSSESPISILNKDEELQNGEQEKIIFRNISEKASKEISEKPHESKCLENRISMSNKDNEPQREEQRKIFCTIL